MSRTELSRLRPLVHGVMLLLALGTLCAVVGCTRRFYRDQADRDVASLLAEKDVLPESKIENYHVYPDSRARFADPTNPDRPPMPPDDPAAQMLAPNPQRPKHAGVGRYEGTGYLELLAAWDAENRGPTTPLRDAESLVPYKINLDQAVELGLINSREFQTKREDLYLAALPVTLERFSFAFQFFAAEVAIREYTGADTGSGKGDHWRFGTGTGFTKLFSTGALLLFSFANRTVVDLSGRMDLSSLSTINLDFVQPLLRGGGRAVTLEPLTQVERNLLYEIRDYARFRKEYYQYITGGVDLVNFRGGFSAFGRAFAPGTVTLGTNNPARPEIFPGGAGRVNLTLGTVAPSEGYLPSVQTKAFAEIDQQNVQRLRGIVKLFVEFQGGPDVSKLQVDQAQLELLNAQNQLARSEKDQRDSIDRFKLQLGVPPQVPVELDDREFTRPVINQFDRYQTIIDQFESARKQIDTYFEPEDAKRLRGGILTILTQSPLAKGTVQFKKTITQRWRLWEQEKFELKNPKDKYLQRVKQADALARIEKQRTLTPKEIAVVNDKALADMELAVREYEKMPWLKNQKELDRQKDHLAAFNLVFNTVVRVLGEARNERKDLAAVQWPELRPVGLADVDLVPPYDPATLDTALEAAQQFGTFGPMLPLPSFVVTAAARNALFEQAYALCTRYALDNRLDLMNARAEEADAWRQVAIYANSLLGAFNVGYHMDSNTPPGQAKPFAFQPSQTRHQLFLNYEAPLVRLAERNNYRAALIAYQRARRELMAAEDQVVAQVRTDLRQLWVLERQLRIQQETVELSYDQLESTLETFRAGGGASGGPGGAGNIAALTSQLLNAYRRLPGDQKQLLTIWIQYRIARQQLYLDLELMPLSSQGAWIDEFSPRPKSQPVASVP